ncbi:MAG: AAA family ATPase [Pseudomonadota bacterium]
MPTDRTRSQDDIISFMMTPGSLGDGAAPEVINTHCAMIFLTKDTAYKIKRAVKYDYLDFSTTDLRRKMLQRELSLNKPGAPTIYRDVMPITLARDGVLALDGSGKPVEWVLRMARFPAADELSQVAERGELGEDLAMQMGQSIARYHERCEPRSADGTALILAIIEELEDAFAQTATELGSDRVEAFSSACRTQFHVTRNLMQRRAEGGRVRRCHGDLHMRNIVLIAGVPTPFDALEFDEDLGTCDTLYDLAFLLMDLMHRDLMNQANVVLNAYRQALPDFDHAGLRLLPLFLGLRAAIRAMVSIQSRPFNRADGTLRADAVAYLDQAIRYLDPPPPRVIAIGGLSGTGKTTIARAIAHKTGAAPGAIHLRSDVERKQMFGVDPLTRLPPDAYQSEVSAKVYDSLRAKAADILAASHGVIIDAVHLTTAERRASEAVAKAAGCTFTGLWLEGDVRLLMDRVNARRGDASDADAAVVQTMSTTNVGAVEWNRIDCSGTVPDTVSRICTILDPSATSG